MKIRILLFFLALGTIVAMSQSAPITSTMLPGNFMGWLRTTIPGCAIPTNFLQPGSSKCAAAVGGGGVAGPQGPAGPQGIPGATGPQGPPGPAGAPVNGGAVVATLTVGNPSAAAKAALPPGANGMAFDESAACDAAKPVLGVDFICASAAKHCIVHSENGHPAVCIQ